MELRHSATGPWYAGKVSKVAKDGSVLVHRADRGKNAQSSEMSASWLSLDEQREHVRIREPRAAPQQHLQLQFLAELCHVVPCRCENPASRLQLEGKNMKKPGCDRWCSPLKQPMCTHCSGECRCRWIHPVLRLLDQAADINGMTSRGDTPLLQAVRSGHDRLVVRLLGMKAVPLRSTDRHGWSPLHEAAKIGKTGLCRAMLEAAAANMQTNSGVQSKLPAIKSAAGANAEPAKPERVSSSSEEGSDETEDEEEDEQSQSASGGLGETSFSQLVSQDTPTPPTAAASIRLDITVANASSSPTCTAAYLASAATSSGCTPLIEAIGAGFVEIASLLLSYAAEVNAQLEDGSTALMRAAGRGDPGLCRLLIEASAHVCSGARTRCMSQRPCTGECGRESCKSGRPCAGRCKISSHRPLQNSEGSSALMFARKAYVQAKHSTSSSQSSSASKTVLLLEQLGVK